MEAVPEGRALEEGWAAESAAAAGNQCRALVGVGVAGTAADLGVEGTLAVEWGMDLAVAQGEGSVGVMAAVGAETAEAERAQG